LAIGGSTNGIIHLAAIAGRVGVDIDLKTINDISDSTPVIVDLKPSGTHYMEDLFYAGGIGAGMRGLKPLLPLDCRTVTGEPLGKRLEPGDHSVAREVIRSVKDPIVPYGGLVSLFGSLAPEGAILKRSAADPKMFEREARCVVFSSLEDLAARIDS